MQQKIRNLTAFVALSGLGLMAFKPANDKFFEIAKNLEIFTNLYKELNTYYVDELNPSKLMRTGVDAMLDSLDPYTNYISESDIEGYRYITEGKYNGFGAQIKKLGESVTIVEQYEGSPAQKAGLKVGDVVVAIDGKSAKGKSSEAVTEIIRGFPGTELEMTIRRPGTEKDQNVKITRDEVNVPNVPYSGMVTKEVGYVALNVFSRDAGKNIADAVEKLKKDNAAMKSIILDLRDNGGGLLTEAVNLVNVFVPKGELVVTTKGRVKDWDRSFKTLNAPVDDQIPLAVLIDKYSASASEIVCGTVQDLDRGVLIGQRSYGKGLVQNTKEVGYNAKLKLTTAKYYIPSGRCIQGVRYENGHPIDIADSLRVAFKTKNGRTTYDGGGVKPDLVLTSDTSAAILRGLYEKHTIFHYVTQFAIKNPTIAAADKFVFQDFEGFKQYLTVQKFTYKTETEKMLGVLRDKTLDREHFSALKADVKLIEEKIAIEKKNDLDKYKAQIISAIEKEIIGRYYYQKGKTQIGLRNDKEIAEAVALLNNPAKYKALLGKN
jgi:carboxyl-terminal processing protease